MRKRYNVLFHPTTKKEEILLTKGLQIPWGFFAPQLQGFLPIRTSFLPLVCFVVAKTSIGKNVGVIGAQLKGIAIIGNGFVVLICFEITISSIEMVGPDDRIILPVDLTVGNRFGIGFDCFGILFFGLKYIAQIIGKFVILFKNLQCRIQTIDQVRDFGGNVFGRIVVIDISRMKRGIGLNHPFQNFCGP